MQQAHHQGEAVNIPVQKKRNLRWAHGSKLQMFSVAVIPQNCAARQVYTKKKQRLY